MSGDGLADLLDRWADDGDESAAERIRERLRASPEARAEYWRWMAVHASLRGALERDRARRSGLLAARPASGRPRLLPRLALGAALAAGVAAAFLLSAPRPAAQPTTPEAVASVVADGATRWVAAGEEARVPAGGRFSVLGEALAIAAESEARLAVRHAPDGALVLDQVAGRLRLDVARRRGPLRVQTPHGRVEILGTSLTVDVGAATRVAVTSGHVTVACDGHPPAPLALGDAATIDAAGVQVRSALLELRRVHRVADWNNCAKAIQALEQRDGAVRIALSPRMPQWAGMLFAPPPDWSGADGVALRFRGQGRGARLQLELIDRDDGAPGRPREQERGERFVADLVDDRPGWREARLRFAEFRRRGMQRAGAPDDGLDLERVTGLTLLAPDGCDLLVDRVGTWRARHLAE